LICHAAGLTNLSFEAPLPKASIPAVMAEADAILLSLRDVPLFRYGVSPNKLYDAYAIARPVVTTVPGAINDEVTTEAIGVAVQPGDPVALGKALLQLAAMPQAERQAMADRARRLAETTYSRQRINAKYDQLLRGCFAR
jgi:glycosyltransferase involved in cell wall biosynthesis